MKAHSGKLLFLSTAVLFLLSLVPACTQSDSGTHPTVFDPAEPDTRSNEVKIGDFVVQLEKKYKRDASRNDVDLHFTLSPPDRIKLHLTYDHDSDPTTANSIADAAVDLVKRLKREDPVLKDIEIGIDREVLRRER